MLERLIKSTTIWLHTVLFVAIMGACASSTGSYELSSPNGQLKVQVSINSSGEPIYQVHKGKSIILNSSSLGIKGSSYSFMDQLELVSVSSIVPKKEQYSMLQGKQAAIDYQYNEQSFSLKNDAGQQLSIVFRVSDDGVAFRYEFPVESGAVVEEELTSFNFPKTTRMFAQPMSVAKTGWQQSNPSYEEHYEQAIPVGTASPLGAGWIFPTLFELDDAWALITESNLGSDYCGSRLVADTVTRVMKIGFPPAVEVFTDLGHLPLEPQVSPWRIITIGSLATIVESTLGTDLAAPAIDTATDYIEPGLASWSWALLKDNSVNYDTSKLFIDYANRMTWKYCLIDVNWDTTIGAERMQELSAYARSKDVGLILWYNSAGEWNTTPYHPRSKLLTHEQREEEFAKLKEWGIAGVKIDFFGGDGQSMIAYYHDILKDAAKHQLLVNFHGATLPRGWQRTYPNLMTMESIKGFEFITFTQENANLEANHSAILPFARNAFDPMDFTPMCFSDIPNIERMTTNGFELALPTLFLSGVQHIAEIPSGMESVPDYVQEYLMDIPVLWDETRFIEGYPGKLAVIARRAGDTWFVSGINGEEVDKKLTLDLSFLNGASGFMITDGPAHPEFIREEVAISGDFEIGLKANGGFVMKVK
ncbi:glycoside hydrolase family 97 catalytic domain-containing protein [Marinoscillum sp.]|uniref:glycoside hydrolase family 97 protein n=1 Tax=Marinoscillum sp. TaxID=2024838 RepID=UPI003BA92275